MYLVFRDPDGHVVPSPALTFVCAMVENDAAYWGSGSSSAGLFAHDKPLVGADGGLVINPGVRQLAVAYKQPYGFHLQFSVMFDQTDVAISRDDYSRTTSLDLGGEPWIIPVAFFVSKEEALEAIQEFYRTGTASKKLRWVNLDQQTWDSK
jgi:hypothetical protein